MWCAIRNAFASRVRSASRYCVSRSPRRLIYLRLVNIAAIQMDRSIISRAPLVLPVQLDPVLLAVHVAHYPAFQPINIPCVRHDVDRVDPVDRVDLVVRVDPVCRVDQPVDHVDHVKKLHTRIQLAFNDLSSYPVNRAPFFVHHYPFSCTFVSIFKWNSSLFPGVCQGEQQRLHLL